jgi:hypothetical protein
MNTVVIRPIEREDGVKETAVFLTTPDPSKLAGVVLNESNDVVAHLLLPTHAPHDGVEGVADIHNTGMVHVRAETYAVKHFLDKPMLLQDYLEGIGTTLPKDLYNALHGIAYGDIKGSHTAALAAEPKHNVSVSR